VAVLPSRVPSCKSVQGLPDTSAFSLRGTCERRQVAPMRLILHLLCSRLAVILHFLSAPSRLSFSRCVRRSRLPPIDSKGLASCLRLSETQQPPTSSPARPYLTYSTARLSLVGSFTANHPWETRCSREIDDSWHEFDNNNPDPGPTCRFAGLTAITL
jgi:hypothetical protein